MRLLLLILTCALFTLGGYRNAYSQGHRSGAGMDRDFQRWLPMPEGGQGNISDQVQLLELLRGQLASGPDPLQRPQLPVPDLTADQLRELDRAYQAWTEQSGGAPLPDLNSIPKEWVDQALANPEQLQQAQRLFEQYARQRKLPMPSTRSGLPQGLKALAQKAREGSASKGSIEPGSKSPTSPFEDSVTPRQELTQPSSDSPDRDSLRATRQRDASRSAQSQATGQQATGQQATGQQATDTFGMRTRSSDLRNDNPRNNSPRNNEPQNRQSGNSDSQQNDLPSGLAAEPGALNSATPTGSRSTNAATAGNPEAAAGSALNASKTLEARRLLSMAEALDEAKQGTGKQGTGKQGTAKQATGSDGTGNMVERSLNQRDRQPDAARLKALRELLEKLKTVQASQKLREGLGQDPSRSQRPAPGSAAHAGSGVRNLDSANQLDSSREADARSSNDDASRRNARSSSTSPSQTGTHRAASNRSTPNGPRPSVAGSVFPRAADRRPMPDGETAQAGSERDQDDRNANSETPRDLAQRSDSFNVPDLSSLASGTFSVSPMKQATSPAPDFAEQGGSAAQRASARRSATQRSSSEDASGHGSGGLRAAGMPSLSSASRTFEIPRITSEMSAGLSSGANQSGLQAKIKRDIEQFGWEKALRRILETTFREDPNAAKPSQANSPNESSIATRPPEPRRNVLRPLSVDEATARRSVDVLTNSRFASVFADVWKAIATAPPPDGVADLASVPIASRASPEGGRKWKWNGSFDPAGGQVQVVLLLIAAVALSVWIGKKRPNIFRSERVIDTRWAKEALAEGIRTRADVVRAFHRFVAQTTEPVSSWWTHRYVARRLIESTPQLSAAMTEFSSVYEQARYMPPEVELSVEQIDRVCLALQQCAAYQPVD